MDLMLVIGVPMHVIGVPLRVHVDSMHVVGYCQIGFANCVFSFLCWSKYNMCVFGKIDLKKSFLYEYELLVADTILSLFATYQKVDTIR